MIKTPQKKLPLKKQTVRELVAPDLASIGGGRACDSKCYTSCGGSGVSECISCC